MIFTFSQTLSRHEYEAVTLSCYKKEVYLSLTGFENSFHFAMF